MQLRVNTSLMIGVLVLFIGRSACADLIFDFDEVEVHESLLTAGGIEVEVPLFGHCDSAGAVVEGFNMGIEIGGDGKSSLPTGFSYPAALPDTNNMVVRGGETGAQGWNIQTNESAAIVVSDILVTANSPSSGDIDVSTPAPVLLANLVLRLDNTTARGTYRISIPDDAGGAFPFVTHDCDGALDPRAGSITVVPEPNSALLISIVCMLLGSVQSARKFLVSLS